MVEKQPKLKQTSIKIFIIVLLSAAVLMATKSCRPDPVWGQTLTEPCKVTFVAGLSDMLNDLDAADVVVDMYPVTESMSIDDMNNLSYAMKTQFASLLLDEIEDTDGWIQAAEAAAQIVATADGELDKTTVPVNVQAEMQAGVYLLVPRSSFLTDKSEYFREVVNNKGENSIASVAQSQRYEYLYPPQMLVLPTKEAFREEVNTGNPSPWLTEVSIRLKPDRTYIMGSLQIVKKTEQFQSEQSELFVFSIEAFLVENGETLHVFSDVAATTIAGNGESVISFVKKIPIGSTVLVTETHSGANAKLKDDVQTKTTEITAGETASVEFINVPKETNKDTQGILNVFEYKSGRGWDFDHSDG